MAEIWLSNVEAFFTGIIDLIRNAEQNRDNCELPDFYCRRLEEYERTLYVLRERISESVPSEHSLINNLQLLINHINLLHRHFENIAENLERNSEVLQWERLIVTIERDMLVSSAQCLSNISLIKTSLKIKLLFV